ncbi:MAG: sigma-54 interaction domain-containing protein [Thermoguttaceae bacterium]
MPTMNTLMIDGTSFEVVGHQDVEAHGSTQTMSRVHAFEDHVYSLAPEVELQTSEPIVREALDVAFKAAASQATILLRGETGVGKEVLARAIHARSPRAAQPLVTLHCAGLSADVLESELFGHVQGGFAVAGPDMGGKVATAEGGTLFLNEIGDLPPSLQPKLLRLLQQRCYTRVGESQSRSSNVRVLAATNRNLEAELAAGRFLKDLYYQLNVIEVTMPPLRDRPADILPLAEQLLRFYAQQDGKAISGFAEPVRDTLAHYAWPGNIRGLRNAIERGVILATGPVIVLADLPSQISNQNHLDPGAVATPSAADTPLTLEQMEAEYIRCIMASTESIGEAATKLGINQSTLYRKRKRYGI